MSAKTCEPSLRRSRHREPKSSRFRYELILVREGDVRAARHIVWTFLALCEPVGARSLTPVAPQGLSRQTLSAAAVRIVSQFGTVTSTFRTVEHNRAVGGVPDSYHLLGQAVDVARRPGVSHAQIAAALTASGLHLIESLDEHNHSHFAFGRALQRVAPVMPQPQPPQAPPGPLLAADQHGTLRMDLAGKAAGKKTRVPASGTGRELVH